MKILVVDDEKLLVKGIKFNLENVFSLSPSALTTFLTLLRLLLKVLRKCRAPRQFLLAAVSL